LGVLESETIMALKKNATNSTETGTEHHRHQQRNLDGLLIELKEGDITTRRWAARDLATIDGSTAGLLAALNTESELLVFEAILDSLEKIGGDEVVKGLIPLLRSEDAGKRNSVIETLQSMPDMVALHIIELLNDTDSDVRIFAIDILQVLAHPDIPQWLLSVLKDETHINVVATAVDRLAEVGTEDMLEDLLALKQRFPDEFYLHFAIDTAIERIKGH